MKIIISKSALLPSQYRKYVKGWDKKRNSTLFRTLAHHLDSSFEGDAPYRIYFPMSGTHQVQPSVPQPISSTLSQLGYEVGDYVQGYAYKKDDPKRTVKIGKLLPDALKPIFVNDPQRAATKAEVMVVLSRHPYDLAGMSTDRGWTSCMNLNEGVNKRYVKPEIEAGSLIAYLVKTNDANITRPIARVLYKPMDGKDGSRLYVKSAIYPANASKSFSSKTDEILSLINASLYNKPQGNVSMRLGKGVYPEYGENELPRTLKLLSLEDALKIFNPRTKSQLAKSEKLLSSYADIKTLCTCLDIMPADQRDDLPEMSDATLAFILDNRDARHMLLPKLTSKQMSGRGALFEETLKLESLSVVDRLATKEDINLLKSLGADPAWFVESVVQYFKAREDNFNALLDVSSISRFEQILPYVADLPDTLIHSPAFFGVVAAVTLDACQRVVVSALDPVFKSYCSNMYSYLSPEFVDHTSEQLIQSVNGNPRAILSNWDALSEAGLLPEVILGLPDESLPYLSSELCKAKGFDIWNVRDPRSYMDTVHSILASYWPKIRAPKTLRISSGVLLTPDKKVFAAMLPKVLHKLLYGIIIPIADPSDIKAGWPANLPTETARSLDYKDLKYCAWPIDYNEFNAYLPTPDLEGVNLYRLASMFLYATSCMCTARSRNYLLLEGYPKAKQLKHLVERVTTQSNPETELKQFELGSQYAETIVTAAYVYILIDQGALRSSMDSQIKDLCRYLIRDLPRLFTPDVVRKVTLILDGLSSILPSPVNVQRAVALAEQEGFI